MKLYDFDFSAQGHKVEISSDVCEVDLGVLPFDESTAGRINSSIKDLTVAEGIRRITNELNVQFTNLNSITLPASMIEIAPSAFTGSRINRIGISVSPNTRTLKGSIYCALSLFLNIDN